MAAIAAVALIAALSAFVAWQIKPARTFAPLTLPDRLALSDGAGGPPPQIAAGKPLTFTPTTWCNAADEPLKGQAAITIVSVASPPQATVPVLAGLPVTIPRGCSAGHNLNLALPTPLVPGSWELALTITVTAHGQTQTASTVSAPFTVTGGAP